MWASGTGTHALWDLTTGQFRNGFIAVQELIVVLDKHHRRARLAS